MISFPTSMPAAIWYRWELPHFPHLYNRDLNNFGPRVGLVWSPRRNTIVRTGYGIYYDYIPQDILIANYTNSAGVATNPSSATNNSISVPVNGLDFNGNVWNGSATGPIYTPTAYTQSIFVTERNFRTPYVQSWNLNIQRQFNAAVAFEMGYVGSKGTRLTRLYDANQDGTNANYYQIAVLATGANSTYNALQTTVRLNDWHHFSGFSTYTWSKSLDGASDGIDFNGATAAFPQNSDDLPAEKGPSTFDTRHRWTSVLNYQLPAFAALPKLLADGWQIEHHRHRAVRAAHRHHYIRRRTRLSPAPRPRSRRESDPAELDAGDGLPESCRLRTTCR